jgi:DNA-directed RNA polymerase specialized sigma subunit
MTVILTKEEREKAIIDLYFNQKKTCRQVAHELSMSLIDIVRTIKKNKGRLKCILLQV